MYELNLDGTTNRIFKPFLYETIDEVKEIDPSIHLDTERIIIEVNIRLERYNAKLIEMGCNKYAVMFENEADMMLFKLRYQE